MIVDMQFDATEFAPWSGLVGGMLIGLASAGLLLLNGRIAGISGIAAGLLGGARRERAWRASFVAGLLASALLWPLLSGEPLRVQVQMDWPWMAVGGLLVGFGTRLGSGCTAGHGISGLARLSPRSAVATAVFFLAAMASVFAVRHGPG